MFRELDQRTANLMTVTLEWGPATGHVQVRCEADRSPDESFCYRVEPRKAALAFRHPFAMRPVSVDRVRSEVTRGQPPLRAQRRWRRWLRPRREVRTSRTPGDHSWP
jgi:hypothetical protein